MTFSFNKVAILVSLLEYISISIGCTSIRDSLPLSRPIWLDWHKPEETARIAGLQELRWPSYLKAHSDRVGDFSAVARFHFREAAETKEEEEEARSELGLLRIIIIITIRDK